MTNLENSPPHKGVTSRPGAEAIDHPAMNGKNWKQKFIFGIKKKSKTGMEWQSVEEGEETLGKKR